MNYLKHYITLIRHARLTPSLPDGYYEKHHVFPVSIFGKNSFTVNLTPRQHYIAHAFLEKIYIKRYGLTDIRTKKMIHAFFMMHTAQGRGQYRYCNSKLYEQSKIRFRESISGPNHPFFGKKRVFSELHLRNLKNSRKIGEENPLYNIPRTEYVKEKMRKPKHSGHGLAVSNGRKGIKFSEEHIKKLSDSHKGKSSPRKGIPCSEETKSKMSESQRNKNKDYITDEYRKKLSDASAKVWEMRRAKKQEKLNGTQ